MAHQSDLIRSDIDAYLLQHEQKDLLRFLSCGSVDDGKSSLIGRLLHDAKLIYEDQLAAIAADSAKSGTTGDEVDLALLVDGLQAEREQGITIDVAYRFFSTAKRKFIIADTPGHEQYTRNMATGASTADLALILIDARQGVLKQTLRHSMIAGLLGIRHFIVAVNKMDLAGYDEQVFTRIQDDYRARLESLRPAWPGQENSDHEDRRALSGTRQDERRLHLCGENILHSLRNLDFIPISALKGDNVVHHSENMPWYNGETLMHRLETIDIAEDPAPWPARLPVQYVNRPSSDFRGYCGNLAAGTLRAGDAATVLPSEQKSRIASVLGHEGPLQCACPPMALTVTLEDDIDVSRGDLIVTGDTEEGGHRALLGNSFYANIVWMTDARFTVGMPYDLKLGGQVVAGEITEILECIDRDLEKSPTEYSGSSPDSCTVAPPKSLLLNEIGHCRLQLQETVAFDPYSQCRGTGAFIMIDRLSNLTIAAGMITGAARGENERRLPLDRRVVRLVDGTSGGKSELGPAPLHGHRGATLFLSGADGALWAAAARRAPGIEALREQLDAGNKLLIEQLGDWFSRRGGCCAVLDARTWSIDAMHHHLQECSPACNAAGLLTYIVIPRTETDIEGCQEDCPERLRQPTPEAQALIDSYCKQQPESYRHLPCTADSERGEDMARAVRRIRDRILNALMEQEPPIILDRERYLPDPR